MRHQLIRIAWNEEMHKFTVPLLEGSVFFRKDPTVDMECGDNKLFCKVLPQPMDGTFHFNTFSNPSISHGVIKVEDRISIGNCYSKGMHTLTIQPIVLLF